MKWRPSVTFVIAASKYDKEFIMPVLEFTKQKNKGADNMLCKNCNYILSGKENFCPNCASPLRGEKLPAPEQPPEEKVPVHEENIISKEYVFPQEETKESNKQPQLHIFSDSDDNGEETQPERKKSYGGRILLMLFLICALAAASFAVIDYFDLTSSVFSFTGGEAQTEEKETEAGLFNHKSSVVKPDISYTPSTAFIMSGQGLTLRKGPDKGYAPLANLSDLTQVEIYGASASAEGWVYVYCSEYACYGWLDGSFLAKAETESQTLFAENQ